MRASTLPSPGNLANSQRLRHEAAHAISIAEVVASKTPGGKTTSASALSTFFTACASALSTLIDVTAPTVSTRVRTAANTATITFTETLDSTVVPAITDFVFTPTRTVTAVTVSGTTCVITATGTVATDSVAYTKPDTNALRDRAGNQVASFSGVLA